MQGEKKPHTLSPIEGVETQLKLLFFKKQNKKNILNVNVYF